MNDKLMEMIFNKRNLNIAYRRVKVNKGTCGVDSMTIDGVFKYLILNCNDLIEEIMNGSYRPKPILKVRIPKDNVKVRLLGIPIVIDRIIQQVIVQELTTIFDPLFCKESY